MGAIFVDDESYSSGVIRTSNKIYDKETGTTVKDDIDAIKDDIDSVKAELNEGITMHEEDDRRVYDYIQNVKSIEMKSVYDERSGSQTTIGDGYMSVSQLSKPIGGGDLQETSSVFINSESIIVSDTSSSTRKMTIRDYDIVRQQGATEVSVFDSLDEFAFKKHYLSPSTPLGVNVVGIGAYGILIVGGLIQGVGAKLLAITITNKTSMSVKDLITGQDFSSSYLSITNDRGAVTLSVPSGVAGTTLKYITF